MGPSKPPDEIIHVGPRPRRPYYIDVYDVFRSAEENLLQSASVLYLNSLPFNKVSVSGKPILIRGHNEIFIGNSSSDRKDN